MSAISFWNEGGACCVERVENRVGYRIEVVPLVVGCFAVGIGKLCKNFQKLIENETKTGK